MQNVTFKLAWGENFIITPNGYIRTDRLLGFLIKYFATSSQAVQNFSSALYKYNKTRYKIVITNNSIKIIQYQIKYVIFLLVIQTANKTH